MSLTTEVYRQCVLEAGNIVEGLAAAEVVLASMSNSKETHGDNEHSDTPKEKEPVDEEWWRQAQEVASKPVAGPTVPWGLNERYIGEVAGKSIVIVDGAYVRWMDEGRNANFVYGGNGYAYPGLIPESTVWIDDVLVDDPLEIAKTVYHEVHEASIMAGGADYETAHTKCNGTDWLILDRTKSGAAMSSDKDKETDETIATGGWGDYAPEPRVTRIERRPTSKYKVVRRGKKKVLK